MILTPVVLVHAACAASADAACATDVDCSLNGVCGAASQRCSCDVPWTGAACQYLGFAPQSGARMYGGANGTFSPTSWGGNAVRNESTGAWHGYFTEIGAEACGLSLWKTHSTVVHAVASSPRGPFVKAGVVLPHEAHNPEVLRVNGSYVLFHIGSARLKSPLTRCNGSSVAATRAARAAVDDAAGVDATEPTCRNFHGVDNCVQMHESATLAGPFTPVAAHRVGGKAWVPCNNPSPALGPNGTLWLACAWSLRASHSGRPEGPWTADRPIGGGGSGGGRAWSNRSWEDPFLWFDARGNWHILAHCYTDAPYAAVGAHNAISGHGFSRDGIAWHWSADEPYSAAVEMAGGGSATFSTAERPKLLFADPARPRAPTHLINGVSAWWGGGATPCAPCKDANVCVGCKVTPSIDSTFTLGRVLSAAGSAARGA